MSDDGNLSLSITLNSEEITRLERLASAMDIVARSAPKMSEAAAEMTSSTARATVESSKFHKSVSKIVKELELAHRLGDTIGIDLAKARLSTLATERATKQLNIAAAKTVSLKEKALLILSGELRYVTDLSGKELSNLAVHKQEQAILRKNAEYRANIARLARGEFTEQEKAVALESRRLTILKVRDALELRSLRQKEAATARGLRLKEAMQAEDSQYQANLRLDNILAERKTVLFKQAVDLKVSELVISKELTVEEAKYVALNLAAGRANVRNSLSSVGAAATKKLGLKKSLRSAYRGTAGALGGLWLAYGQILPMLAAFAGMAGLKSAVSEGANFNQQLAFIAGMSDNAGQHLESLRAKMLSIADIHMFKPRDLAEEARVMARSGLSITDSIKAIGPVAAFAEVGEINLASATEIVNAAMHVYKLTASDIPDITNVIAKAAASSSTTIQKMGEAFSYTGSLAQQFHFSLRDVAAMLAVLAQRGITGSKAGTALNNMFVKLAAPSEKAKKVMQEIGFSLFDSENHAKSMTKAMKDLTGVYSEYGEKSQASIAKILFGLRSLKGAQALLSGSDDLKMYVQKLKHASDGVGFVNQALDKLESTVTGVMRTMKSSLQVGLIDAFQDSNSGIKRLSLQLRELVRGESFRAFLKDTIHDVVILTKLVADHIAGIGELLKLYVEYKALMLGYGVYSGAKAAIIGLSESIVAQAAAAEEATAATSAETVAITGFESETIAATAATNTFSASFVILRDKALAFLSLPVIGTVLAIGGAVVAAYAGISKAQEEANKSFNLEAVNKAAKSAISNLDNQIYRLRLRNRLQKEGSAVNVERSDLSSELSMAKARLAALNAKIAVTKPPSFFQGSGSVIDFMTSGSGGNTGKIAYDALIKAQKEASTNYDTLNAKAKIFRSLLHDADISKKNAGDVLRIVLKYKKLITSKIESLRDLNTYTKDRLAFFRDQLTWIVENASAVDGLPKVAVTALLKKIAKIKHTKVLSGVNDKRDYAALKAYYSKVTFADSHYFKWKSRWYKAQAQAQALSGAQKKILYAKDIKSLKAARAEYKDAHKKSYADLKAYYSRVTFADYHYFEWKSSWYKAQVQAQDISNDKKKILYAQDIKNLKEARAKYKVAYRDGSLPQKVKAYQEDLRSWVKSHKKAADQIDALWDNAFNSIADSMTSWIKDGKADLAGLVDTFETSVARMVSTWLVGQAKMAFTGQKASAEQISAGNSLGIASLATGGSMGAGSSLALAAASGLHELFNPGSYAASLGNLQVNIADTLVDFNSGLADTAQGLEDISTAAMGAWTAGIGTFVTDLLSGQSIRKSAASGLGAGGGAYGGFELGNMVMPGVGGVIGGIIGGALGALGLGNLLGGGHKKKTFTLSELSHYTANKWHPGTGINQNNTDKWSGDWYSPVANSYVTAMNATDSAFNKQVQELKSKMSSHAWEAFSKALASQTFNDTNGGRWDLSDAQSAITGVVTAYSKELTAGLNAALKAALPAMAEDLTSKSSGFAVLTDSVQSAINNLIHGASFDVKKLNELNNYLNKIAQAKSPIDELLATHGLTAYQKQIRKINQQFATYAVTLKAAGIDLKKYTGLQKAHNQALQDAATANLKSLYSNELQKTTSSLRASYSLAISNSATQYSDIITKINKRITDTGVIISELGTAVSSLSASGAQMVLSANKLVEYHAAQQTLDAMLTQARAGNFNDLKGLGKTLGTLGGLSQTNYKNAIAYKRDFYHTKGSILSLQKLAENSKSAADITLDTLKSQLKIETNMRDNAKALLTQQLNALLQINTSVLSIPAATTAYQSAKADVARVAYKSEIDQLNNSNFRNWSRNSRRKVRHRIDVLDNLLGLPRQQYRVGFASGGGFGGGYRIVGEQGPELEYTGPSHIFSNPASREIMDTSALLAELQKMRELNSEMRDELKHIRRTNKRISDIAEKTDAIGPLAARAA